MSEETKKIAAFGNKYNLGVDVKESGLLKTKQQFCKACGSKLNNEQASTLRRKAIRAYQQNEREESKKQEERQKKKEERKQKRQVKKEELKKKVREKIKDSNLRVLREHYLLDNRVPVKGNKKDKADARSVNNILSNAFASTALERIETRHSKNKARKQVKEERKKGSVKSEFLDADEFATKVDRKTQSKSKAKLDKIAKVQLLAKERFQKKRTGRKGKGKIK